MGYGEFALFDVISDLKCDFCPYKRENFRPLMNCKQILVKKSCYTVKTIIKDANGIPNAKVTKPDYVTGEKDLSILGHIRGHVLINAKHI